MIPKLEMLANGSSFHLSVSADFCDKWKFLLKNLYNYKFEGEFAVVKTILGAKTFSYLPLLNYTDVMAKQVKELKAQIPAKASYQIRALNPEYKTFQYSDTVTMRLGLERKDINTIWLKALDQKCRNQVRQSDKSGLVVRKGVTDKLISDFYMLYKNTMHYHGTPCIGHKLFYLMSKMIDSVYYVVYKNNNAISALVVINDCELAIIGWGASDRNYFRLRPNNFMYWEAVKDAYEAGKKTIDFGRSSFKGGTFSFKKHFGAVPVKIDILKRNPENIYKKYQTASIIWKKLPRKVSYYMGPRLCKYLIDL